MTTGRFQRSEDGVTWETIDPQAMRRRLSNVYRDVDSVVKAMTDDAQVIPGQFGVQYRFNRDAS